MYAYKNVLAHTINQPESQQVTVLSADYTGEITGIKMKFDRNFLTSTRKPSRRLFQKLISLRFLRKKGEKKSFEI